MCRRHSSNYGKKQNRAMSVTARIFKPQQMPTVQSGLKQASNSRMLGGQLPASMQKHEGTATGVIQCVAMQPSRLRVVRAGAVIDHSNGR